MAFAGHPHLHLGALIRAGSLLLVLAVLGPAEAHGDSEGRVRALRYPKAYDTHAHERKEYGTFTVSFKVRLPFPSDTVLRFYDRELRKMGWEPFAESSYENNYRRWDCFEDWSQKGNPLIHQLGAKWANKEKTRMVLLVLAYYSYGVERTGVECPGPQTDVQEVDLQLMPFVTLPTSGTPPPHGQSD